MEELQEAAHVRTEGNASWPVQRPQWGQTRIAYGVMTSGYFYFEDSSLQKVEPDWRTTSTTISGPAVLLSDGQMTIVMPAHTHSA